MTDECERCRQSGVVYYPAWDMTLCDGCAAEYRQVEEAYQHLNDLIQPIIRLWAHYWQHLELSDEEIVSNIQVRKNISESRESLSQADESQESPFT